MKLFFFIALIFSTVLSASTKYGIKEGKSLNAISSVGQSEIIVDEKHEVQIIGDAGWARKVMIYDAQSGKAISKEPFLISKKFLNEAIESKKEVLEKPLRKYDEMIKGVNELQSLGNVSGASCDEAPAKVLKNKEENADKTYKELLCVIKAYDKDNPVSNASASYKNLEILGPGLQAGVKELSLNSVTSRRHFYSQILHETGFFRSLTEEGKDSDFDKDKKYKAKWKGRGVIQLTGCANYINFLLYLNINRSGLEQKSIRRYIIGNDQFGNGENSLYCDDSKVSKLLKTPIFKINPYNKIPFNNPDILKVMTSSSADLDKLAQGKIKSIGGLSSEDLNLGGSIHFWKRSILGDPNLKSALENDSVESQVMITKRVNGGLKGLDARLKIFPYTEGCVK